MKKPLNENPFSVPTPDGGLAYEHSDDSYAFGFHKTKNKAYIGNSQDHHDQIYLRYEYDDEYGNAPMKRNDFRFPGRFWTNYKIISFWVYPSRYQFFPLTKTLENHWKERFPNKDPIDFSDDWYVEVMGEDDNLKGNLVPFSDYQKESDPENLSHTSSLMEVQRFRRVIQKIIEEEIRNTEF